MPVSEIAVPGAAGEYERIEEKLSRRAPDAPIRDIDAVRATAEHADVRKACEQASDRNGDLRHS